MTPHVFRTSVMRRVRVRMPIPMPMRVACALVCGLAVAGACADGTSPDDAIATPAVWAVQLNHHAVALSVAAPSNTVQLVATPVDTAGMPVSRADRPRFFSSDSSVTVDSTGLATANFPTTNAYIVAVLTTGNITYRDTAFFTVTTNPPPLPVATLSIQPAPGDSAKFAYGGYFFSIDGVPTYVTQTWLNRQVLDADGDSIPSVPIAFQSSNTLVATIARDGGVRPVLPGKTFITASSLVYGVVKTDTLTYTVGLALGASYSINDVVPPNGGPAVPTMSPRGTVTFGVGAEVSWYHPSTTASGLIFDDSIHVSPECDGYSTDPTGAGGNIAPWAADATHRFPGRVRCFFHPGVYTYHSTLSTVRDTIIILAEH